MLADWFKYEANPPRLRHTDERTDSSWTRRLVEALRLGRVEVTTGYPVAGHRIDVVIGAGDAAFGVETTVHPEGAEAHAERHLTLRRAGWHLVSAFESDWMAQPEEASVQLAAIAARRAQAQGEVAG